MDNEKKTKGKHGVPQGYLDMKDVCALFGRSRKGIAAMIADGRLEEPLKNGRQNVWDKKTTLRRLENAKFCK